MTKVRPPLSIENTLLRVLGEIGLDEAARLTGRTTGYLHSLTDPDKRECLAVRDLETLDLEHHQRFGTGFPLFEAVGRRLGSARAERFADAAAIGEHARTLSREHAEALAALLDAALATTPDKRVLEKALREAEDLDHSVDGVIAAIRSAIEHVASAPRAPP